MKVWQLGFGLFHLCLNLIWALLLVHRGTISQTGSLTFFFAVLEKTRLGEKHPDYHTLLAALTQILHGIILNAWHVECDHPSLAAFTKSEPTDQELFMLAQKIIDCHATPMHELKPEKKKKGADPGTVPPTNFNGAPDNILDPRDDKAHHNLHLLTHDLLYVIELIRAISDGDWGRIEDILANLAMMFRGAGSNNYCMEILHFIYNLKKVWTPDFVDIMRDNMIVNISGLVGHCMPIDLNIEHIIGYLKVDQLTSNCIGLTYLSQFLFSTKGLYSTWERLGNISAIIEFLQNIKKQMGASLGAPYTSRSHETPNTLDAVWKVTNKVKDLQLNKFKLDREGNNSAKLTANVLALGEQRLKSSTLANFNKKVQRLYDGYAVVAEVDEIPEMGISVDLDGERQEGWDFD
ncbi:hypothetical protein PILCRDRAFT_822535, partial [Piloderma croceum F 1598]